ncbi:MAG: DUF177 domain-containing protein [Desulfocapsa sp.]|nr:DUF177 domain-containing protein [Desulfocapsa sp.]
MKILLTDITGENKSFKIQEPIDFSEESFELTAPLQARLTVRQQDDDIYSLAGNLQARIATGCDRCGKGVELEIEQDFSYELRLEDEPLLPAEYDSSKEDCDVVYLDQPFIESRAILSEQLLLAMPLHRLCYDACRGLCNDCGVDLNIKKCQCREKNTDSPFAVLKKLTQAKEK